MSLFGRPPPPPPAHSSPFGVNPRIPNRVPTPPGNRNFLFGIIPVAGVQWDYPLVQADCKYQLVDVYLSAALTHTFKSHATQQSHVSYVFPLPPDSSVHEFTAHIGDRVVKGVIKKKGEAKTAFNEAVAHNQQAALLEQGNEEVFKLSLGNILPGQTIKVQISFVSVISHEGVNDTLRLTFPTSIAPRYGTPPENSSGSTQLALGSSFNFQVSTQVGGNITSIGSPSHPISSQFGSSGPEPGVNFDPSTAFISLTSATFLENDIILVIGCKDLDRQRCVVESYTSTDSQTATDAYALTFVPRFKLSPVPQQEYLFLVDRSGSMGGGKIEALRSALQIMLKSLPNKGSSFNIISFGSHHSKLWSQTVPYTAENVQAASAHVDTMSADFGGTEMQAALLATFSSRTGANPPPASVFVLTDGECWNLDAVRGTIRNAVNASTSSFLRVFCMGIGNQVSKAMCEAISKAVNGTAVYVTEGEKPDRKLVNLLRAAQLPPVTNLELDWGISEPKEDVKMNQDDDDDFVDLGVKRQNSNLSLFDESYDPSKGADAVEIGASPAGFRQYPVVESMPTLLPGSRYSFYAIVDRGPNSKKGRSDVVRLKGTVLGQPISLEIPVANVDAITSLAGLSKRLIHLIAARSIVQGLEEQGSKSQVLSMGMQYGLVTSETSFVAINERILPTASFGSTYAPPQRTYGAVSLEAFSRMMSVRQSSRNPFIHPMPEASAPMPAFGARLLAQPTGFASSPQSFGTTVLFDGMPAAAAAVPAPTMAVYGSAMPSPPKLNYRHSLWSEAESLEREVRKPSFSGTPECLRDSVSRRTKRMDRVAPVAAPAPSRSSGADIESSVEALARIQSFDGSFAPSIALYRIIVNRDAPPAQPSSLQALTLNNKSKEILWCSILVVAYLTVHFVDEEDVWSIFTEKTIAWAQNLLSGARLDDDHAEALIEELRTTASQIVVK